MNRRDILKGAVAGAGLTSANAQHVHHAPDSTDKAKSAQQPWKPLLFDEHQNATVVVLTELVIPATDTPGAKAAKVNEFIDLLLHDGPDERRNKFLWGLSWLDGFAIREHGKPFVRCTEPEQVAMLTNLDRMPEVDRYPELEPGMAFFEDLKKLTIAGYYTTEIGIKELNKNGVPSSFGCQHGGKH